MVIKALSLWQPWASLIADGYKRFETRSWKTNYRGPLLICAAKRPVNLIEADKPVFYAGLHCSYYLWMPRGVALCVADLVGCLPVTHRDVMAVTPPASQEFALGDFSPGRFAWKLENVRKLYPMFPVRGRQGLFNVEIPQGLVVGE